MNSKQKELISSFKNASSADTSKLIPIYKEGKELIGWLKPINNAMADNENIISSLVRWRRMYMRYFLTQFEPSNERTQKWLKQTVLKDDSKILFMILAENKKIIGNFGITNITRDSAELDNLIRGEKGGDPKLIFYSELALINWIYNVLDIENIILHVMSSNIKTIVFHESVGFVGCNKINLMIKKHDNEIIYTKDLTRDPLEDEKYLLQMSINKKDFLKKYSWLT